MKPTQFLSAASGVSERISGFTAHLRTNGYSVGVRETECLLQALETIEKHDSNSFRLACRSILATCADRYKEFDEHFNAYWFNYGRQHNRYNAAGDNKPTSAIQPFQPGVDNQRLSSDEGDAMSADDSHADNDTDAMSQAANDGRLVGSRISNTEKVDLREFITAESVEQAQAIAARLAAAMAYRRSRRYRADNRGRLLDLRKIMRHAVSRGNEPFQLFSKRPPVKPIRLVALLDVSGSMLVYSRVFLAFLKGLISHDTKTDAYLFHTSLVRISETLRDPHTLRAINALTLKAHGFGGGTKIGRNIETFNEQYARQSVNARTVVIILSDGYDTDPPERLANALTKLRKRGCKIVWLNPLKSWKDYAPVAAGMQAALPYIDVFESANTLKDLAELEYHLANL